MGRTLKALLGSVAMLLAAGCGSGGSPAPTATGSPSPSHRPTCEGVRAPDAAPEIRKRSSVDKTGDLPALLVELGGPICPDAAAPAAGGGVTIAMTYVRFGKPGTAASVLAPAEAVGRYDGTAPLRIAFPLLGTPCTGTIVHVGGDPGRITLPTPLLGVATGTDVYDPYDLDRLLAGSGAARDDEDIIAVDSVEGPGCSGKTASG